MARASRVHSRPPLGPRHTKCKHQLRWHWSAGIVDQCRGRPTGRHPCGAAESVSHPSRQLELNGTVAAWMASCKCGASVPSFLLFFASPPTLASATHPRLGRRLHRVKRAGTPSDGPARILDIITVGVGRRRLSTIGVDEGLLGSGRPVPPNMNSLSTREPDSSLAHVCCPAPCRLAAVARCSS